MQLNKQEVLDEVNTSLISGIKQRIKKRLTAASHLTKAFGIQRSNLVICRDSKEDDIEEIDLDMEKIVDPQLKTILQELKDLRAEELADIEEAVKSFYRSRKGKKGNSG